MSSPLFLSLYRIRVANFYVCHQMLFHYPKNVFFFYFILLRLDLLPFRYYISALEFYGLYELFIKLFVPRVLLKRTAFPFIKIL